MKKRGRGRPKKQKQRGQTRLTTMPARGTRRATRDRLKTPAAQRGAALMGEPRQPPKASLVPKGGRLEPERKPLTLKKAQLGLKADDFSEGRICFNVFKPKLEYKWDAGVAIGRYLDGLKKGVLLGRSCKHCSRVLIPPRMFCEWCFKPTSEWIRLADTGTVNTFSICYVTWDMKRLVEPQIPAVIEIDGASKGFGILHLLGEIEPFKVRIGIPVQAVWKPPEERQGAITDIKYFKPV